MSGRTIYRMKQEKVTVSVYIVSIRAKLPCQKSLAASIFLKKLGITAVLRNNYQNFPGISVII